MADIGFEDALKLGKIFLPMLKNVIDEYGGEIEGVLTRVVQAFARMQAAQLHEMVKAGFSREEAIAILLQQKELFHKHMAIGLKK